MGTYGTSNSEAAGGESDTVRPDVADPDPHPAAQPDILKGKWLTSFSGLIHDLPVDDKAVTLTDPDIASRPPHLPAFYLEGGNPAAGKFHQTYGYYPFVGQAIVQFDGHGGLRGSLQNNRGGKKRLLPTLFEGTYRVEAGPPFHVFKGGFEWILPTPSGGPIEMRHEFVMRSFDELEWIFTGSNYRGVVTGGTMRRIALTAAL